MIWGISIQLILVKKLKKKLRHLLIISNTVNKVKFHLKEQCLTFIWSH